MSRLSLLVVVAVAALCFAAACVSAQATCSFSVNTYQSGDVPVKRQESSPCDAAPTGCFNSNSTTVTSGSCTAITTSAITGEPTTIYVITDCANNTVTIYNDPDCASESYVLNNDVCFTDGQSFLVQFGGQCPAGNTCNFALRTYPTGSCSGQLSQCIDGSIQEGGCYNLTVAQAVAGIPAGARVPVFADCRRQTLSIYNGTTCDQLLVKFNQNVCLPESEASSFRLTFGNTCSGSASVLANWVTFVAALFF